MMRERELLSLPSTTGPPWRAPGVSFTGSKIDNFMDEDGNMMEGWVVNLNGGVLRRPSDVAVGTALDAAGELEAPATGTVHVGDLAAAFNMALQGCP